MNMSLDGFFLKVNMVQGQQDSHLTQASKETEGGITWYGTPLRRKWRLTAKNRVGGRGWGGGGLVTTVSTTYPATSPGRRN